jgi:ABC-type glycerol-3-phosphate transport system permease component
MTGDEAGNPSTQIQIIRTAKPGLASMNQPQHNNQNWNSWYAAVGVALIALIVFFYFFTQYFA